MDYSQERSISIRSSQTLWRSAPRYTSSAASTARGSSDERAARATGRAFAEKALAIDEANSLAIAVLALSHLFDHMEGISKEPFDKIFANFKRALELDPADANALNWLGIAYSFVGNHEKAVETLHPLCRSRSCACRVPRQSRRGAIEPRAHRQAANAVVDAAVDAGVIALSPVMLCALADLKRREAFLFQAVNAPALRGWRKFGALYDAISRPGDDHRALAAELETFLDETEASMRAYALLNAIGDYGRPLLGTHHWIPAMRGYRRSP